MSPHADARRLTEPSVSPHGPDLGPRIMDLGTTPSGGASAPAPQTVSAKQLMASTSPRAATARPRASSATSAAKSTNSSPRASPPDHIRAGLDRHRAKGLYPSTLPSLVNEAMNAATPHPPTPTGRGPTPPTSPPPTGVTCDHHPHPHPAPPRPDRRAARRHPHRPRHRPGRRHHAGATERTGHRAGAGRRPHPGPLPPRPADHPQVTAWDQAIAAAGRPGPGGAPGIAHGPSLLIAGPTGTGKTHQAYGAIRALLSAGVRLRWEAATAADLYARLRPRPGHDAERELQTAGPLPAAAPGRPRRGQEQRVDRGAHLPADQPPLQPAAPDPGHHQPPHRRAPHRTRRPRRLPPRRDDRTRHPHRPRPQAPVPNLTGPGDSPRRTRDRKPQMVRSPCTTDSGDRAGTYRGPVPFAVPAGDGPPNTPSGTGPAQEPGTGPGPKSGDRSPDASGTGPHRTQQIRGPVPTKAPVTARAAPSLVPETRDRRRAPGTGTVTAPPLRVLAGHGNQPPEARVPKRNELWGPVPVPIAAPAQKATAPFPKRDERAGARPPCTIARIPTRPIAPTTQRVLMHQSHPEGPTDPNAEAATPAPGGASCSTGPSKGRSSAHASAPGVAEEAPRQGAQDRQLVAEGGHKQRAKQGRRRVPPAQAAVRTS